jgi:hypothetical protein
MKVSSPPPPTPQQGNGFVVTKQAWLTRGSQKEETISLDTIYEHYMNVARRLTRQCPDCSPSPVPSSANAEADANTNLDANLDAILEMESNLEELAMMGDSVQGIDWLPLEHWMLAGTMTLDELPDSETWSSPEYQLTHEWYEQTIWCLREAEGEAKVDVEAEMEVEVDVEMEDALEPRGS